MLLAAGCGSTVPLDQIQAAGLSTEGATPGDDGLSLTQSPDGTAPAGGDPEAAAATGLTTSPSGSVVGGGTGSGTLTPGFSSPGAPAGAGGGSGSGAPRASSGGGTDPTRPGGTGRTPGSTAPRAPGRAPVYAPGVTASEIVYGTSEDSNTSEENSTLLGVEGVTQGDIPRYYEIMRTEINKGGGIAGRKLRYSRFRYNTSGAFDIGTLEGQACDYWARDDRAFAVDASLTGSENLIACLHKNRLVGLGGGFTEIDGPVFAKYPNYYELGAMRHDRQQRNLVKGLVAMNYFDRGYKLGVVYYNSGPFIRSFDQALVPALARAGKKVSEQSRVRRLNSYSDLSELTAQIQSTVLKFKTEKVTHVSFIEDTSLLAFLFARSAENQDYRPRYALSTQSSAVGQGIPPEQLRRSVGIGWDPTFDVPPKERPSDADSRRCLATFKRYGEEPADPNNESIMVGVCQEIEFFKAMVEAGLPDITPDSFRRAVETVGSRFPGYGSLGGNYFAPGRHDSATAFRTLYFDASCDCAHYKGPVYRDRS